MYLLYIILLVLISRRYLPIIFNIIYCFVWLNRKNLIRILITGLIQTEYIFYGTFCVRRKKFFLGGKVENLKNLEKILGVHVMFVYHFSVCNSFRLISYSSIQIISHMQRSVWMKIEIGYWLMIRNMYMPTEREIMNITLIYSKFVYDFKMVMNYTGQREIREY